MKMVNDLPGHAWQRQGAQWREGTRGILREERKSFEKATGGANEGEEEERRAGEDGQLEDVPEEAAARVSPEP